MEKQMLKKWTEAAVFVPEVRTKAQLWCKDHDLDIHAVPVDGCLEQIDDNHIRLEMFVLDEYGNMKRDPDSDEMRPVLVWQKITGTMPPDELVEDVVLP